MKVFALVVLTNGLFILLMGESEAFLIIKLYSPQNERKIVFLNQDMRENKFQKTTTIPVKTSLVSTSTKFEPDDFDVDGSGSDIDGSGSGSGPISGSSLLAPGDIDSEL
ncbi:uncharacterized protein LOC141529622 [Cotesia typhae]|uniref:uncharacterized protein LOC141529622 n=1 Tax=Cotesia typhae TaxID=2053667 RepID=UPI003D689AE2